MTALIRNLNALWIIVYCAIISMAFGFQIFKGEMPCPLCYIQRISMILVCIAAALNLIYGVRLYHYALAIFAAMLGGGAATRQILLHICPGFTQFGVPFWGLSLYVWSYLTFICSTFLAAVLIALYRKEQEQPFALNGIQALSVLWLTLVILANIASTLWQCGLGPCRG